MPIVDLVLPKLGESIMEATILKWYKKVGDTIQLDETLLDIATDKVDSGGASLNGGAGSIAGSLIGALIMAVLRNGSSQSGWPNYMQEIIIGMVIVAAVGLDKFRQRKARG